MAGGVMLMGVLLALLPVSTAMVMHGLIQIVGNFSRAALHVRHIAWGLVGRYLIGVVAAVVLLALMAWRPSEPWVLIMLGLTPVFAWIPERVLVLNVERRGQAELCGFLVQTLNTLAGVAGPLLDLFFVRSGLPRHRVVATKAATQVLAHTVKIGFWGGPMLAQITSGSVPEGTVLPPVWLFAVVIPLSITGTWLGGRILNRMSDANFRTWTRWIVTAVGAVYLIQGISKLVV
jgi:uncharacterized membrane protein YfcA